MLLDIHHTTTYRYARPVVLMPHRLILCPRSTPQLTPGALDLHSLPQSQIAWTQDVFGNLIATATFTGVTDELTISSRMTVEQNAAQWPVFDIAPHAHSYPFDYSVDEKLDLGRLLVPDAPDPGGELYAWVRAIVAGDKTDTLALLQDLNVASRAGMTYIVREEEGTQSPLETLALRSGSCRDLATLFIEAARHLGFGARAVSGYLYDPPHPGSGEADQQPQHGATHAWAEVYLPCAGWITFDPTNSRMGEANLVPVAVARNIAQIPPIAGSYVGSPEDQKEMSVEVIVSAVTAPTAIGSITSTRRG